MDNDGTFADYDLSDVYHQSREYARDPSTSNFVVEFGRADAQIAFDLDIDQFRHLLSPTTRPENRPIRWMYVVLEAALDLR